MENQEKKCVYDFSVQKQNGEMESLKKYEGKVLLIVNTATKCGFTPQYDALEKTVQRYNTEILDIYKNQSNKYYTIILGTILLLGIVIITFSIITINNNKKSKKKYKLQKESKEVKKIKKDDDLAIKEDIKEN